MEKNVYSLLILLEIVLLIGRGHLTGFNEGKATFCKCEDFPIDGKPFMALWNAPTGGCSKNFSIPIELGDFKILSNPQQTWNGKYVVVFYNAQLGYYPYFTNAEGTNNHNGGMPQLVDLNIHIRKSTKDIIKRIPDPHFNGLAVIDWEGWRPIWSRNWGSKKIYQTRSIEILRSQHPDWSMEQLVEQAQYQFENHAQRMMHETLKLGKFLRPKAKWGFYGFPDCYGHENTNYMCSDEHKDFNDRLQWMFSDSTALFPSIYLPENSPTNGAFVRGRLLETLRLREKYSKKGSSLPIFPYFRLIYEKNPLNYDFLTNVDLYNTIGQAADFGAAGIVMWGNRRDENTSPEICRKLNDYIQTHLGPYFKNTEQESEKCSEERCNGNGRCIKENMAIEFNIYQDDIQRKTCPGIPKRFSFQNRKNNSKLSKNMKTASNLVDKLKETAGKEMSNTVVQKEEENTNNSKLKSNDKTALKEAAKPRKKSFSKEGTESRNDNTNHKKYESKESIKDFVTAKSAKIDRVPFLDVHEEALSDKNRTSSTRSETPNQPADLPSETIYCNKTESGTTKCMVVRRHNSMKLSKHNNFEIPKIYAVLISISLGGAFVLSTVYLASYYYFNIFKKRQA
ncbi:hyaluronidase-1-like [Actinia tenebrosa]|uniref:Hyaluronidase n=1 Tax=Actinia tenebrosa TaxID=6105 RepID=A0A6P8IDM0_ACTTE|nr:hyaluronidase-1-like [Actinia tenebrosa]